jgi:hypothetical protein
MRSTSAWCRGHLLGLSTGRVALRTAPCCSSPRVVLLLLCTHLLCRYYDGQLVADDEMAAAAGCSECRDVVLAPPPPEAPAGSMPRPAAAAGSGSGLVLLSRAYSEDKLYTQVRAGLMLLRLAMVAAAAVMRLTAGSTCTVGGASYSQIRPCRCWRH